jgi:heterodisulfide reductase subunit A-like polyferredoxin
MKKSVSIQKGCVACGSCARECPCGAISIHKGLYALPDAKKCVGCGKCADACPAA